MATRLGNRLRAAETRPDDRYGLDAITCWPRLWLVVPQAAQDEVTAARRALDACAEVWLWAALFCGWGVLSWWTVPVGVVVAAGAYRAILAAAGVYAELVVACYDLNRTALYRALRWPVPGTPAEERTAGRELTRYLARGAAPAGLSFATAAEGEAVQAP